ncbi:MAG: SDR family NAD(P)-dependent oxidoreductase [bacterium]
MRRPGCWRCAAPASSASPARAAKAAEAFASLGIDGDAVACDLGDLASVRAAVDQVRGLAPLDGIIANAGIMALPTLTRIHGYEAQFFTNHVGHFVLVTGLVDRLKPAVGW